MPPELGLLKALTRLDLADAHVSSLPPQLSRLTALKQLDLGRAKLTSLPHELGCLTALTRLVLESAKVTSLPDSITRLSNLRELKLRGIADLALPPGLTACRQPTGLGMESDSNSPVLASLQSLRCLWVSVSHSGSRAPMLCLTYWTQLTALTELHLIYGEGSFHGDLAELRVLFDLSKLELKGAHVGDLPAVPHLSRLESLRMIACSFRAGLLANLAAATQLRHLEVSELLDRSGFTESAVYLTAADIAVLTSLPSLESLTLDKPDRMGQRGWNGRLGLLRTVISAKSRAPPAGSLEHIDARATYHMSVNV